MRFYEYNHKSARKSIEVILTILTKDTFNLNWTSLKKISKLNYIGE